MPALTVFTPTYNRAHTLPRTYRSLCAQTSHDFEWLVIDDGSTDGTRQLVASFMAEGIIPIRYIHKENGGLYTGYNTAYANIGSELCCCVDSDDFMPPHAVDLILRTWRERGSDRYAGIVGLDFDARTGMPLGGYFPEGMSECMYADLYIRGTHRADTKSVLRTALMREVAPQTGFDGEKNFNPVYMQLQVCDTRPMLVVNDNLCCVEYQTGADSMSEAIWRQYVDSPRSFAKLRRLEMQLRCNTAANRLRVAVHYVASCVLARDSRWLADSPRRALTLAAAPAGLFFALYIRYKFRKFEISKKHSPA